ncbi:hypothetical protein B1B04_08275 [Lysinibacillus sp. KCTC 33748]|uniref:hypothetical protein n=1 Tax=unclassified Lysinibacillus TaxID=2636778 RepID=UPI0009A88B59|nr:MULTISPECIES: hypothetical protein [unclassified Lysinibacillus]OXS74879.1 hypothetical protein B1B04_08275 [Lysinibacillus sp. KCTC 33748]
MSNILGRSNISESADRKGQMMDRTAKVMDRKAEIVDKAAKMMDRIIEQIYRSAFRSRQTMSTLFL